MNQIPHGKNEDFIGKLLMVNKDYYYLIKGKLFHKNRITQGENMDFIIFLIFITNLREGNFIFFAKLWESLLFPYTSREISEKISYK